jgi:hypothetical protein
VRVPLRVYRCGVCRWQGPLEPEDAGDAAACPQCGVYLYPLTWAQTWGLALLLVGLGLGGASAAVRLVR